MSMTLAARASHVHHVSGRVPKRQSTMATAPHVAPFIWFRRKLIERPGATLAHCVFVIAAGMILANALAFQRKDNPRAFLGEQAGTQSANPARALQPPGAVPLPPVRPAELSAAPPRGVATQPPAATAGAPSRPATASQRDQQAGRDPIGDLIRSGQVSQGASVPDTARAGQNPAAPLIQATPARPQADIRPVASAQRALNRIGLGPVREDGVFGEETRAALERFERDRRIAVTRDLSPRTLRELTAASGIRME